MIEENLSSNISDAFSQKFFWIYLSRQGKQKKNKQLGFYQTKEFCTAKGVINKIKIQPTKWENIFADTFDKDLIFKVYKIFTNLNTKNQITQLTNGHRTCIDTSPNKTQRWTIDIGKDAQSH